MIKEEHIQITGWAPERIRSVAPDGVSIEYTFFSLDVEFLLFNSIQCKASYYVELNNEEEIKKELLNFMNGKLNKKPSIKITKTTGVPTMDNPPPPPPKNRKMNNNKPTL